MARNTSDSYSFLIDTIKELPVIASQDQEFWLAAAMSCGEVIDCSTKKKTPSKSYEISVTLLLNVFARCINSYDNLVKSQSPQSMVPSLDQILVESIEARERIFQFRVSRLLKCLNGPYSENEDRFSAGKIAAEIAQCLSVLPLGFLSYWRSSLENHGKSPSPRSAFLYFLDVDCVVLQESIETAGFIARQTLIEGYLRYGLRMALGYVNMGIEYSDLVQEAALGLVVAAEKYAYLEHGRFALFATTWMWQHITRSLANDSRLIRLPVHLVQRRNDLQKQLAEHLDKIRHVGSLTALIESKGFDVDECLPVLSAGVLPVRLDSPSPGLTKQDLEVLLASSANTVFQFDTYDRDVLVDTILRELSPQQRDVISLRFGLYADEKEHTLDEVGCGYGLTRERIRQIEKKALEKLSRLAMRAQPDPSQRTESINRNPRVLEAISCDEALYPAHPYMADDRHKLGVMLNRSFGSRQSIVRQGLTIKGRILAAFEMHGTPLHTREIYENVRALFPFEDHLETTLYSVMAGNPGIFVSLGDGVFGLTTDAGSVDTAQKESLGVSVNEVEERRVFGKDHTEFLLEAPTDSDSSSAPPGCKPESPEFPLQAMRCYPRFRTPAFSPAV
jgi:RNA polymerase primary sigma factor